VELAEPRSPTKDLLVVASFARAERYTVQLQAVKIEGGQRPPSLLHLKGFKGDGYPNNRA
jgi:hypothetical protein